MEKMEFTMEPAEHEALEALVARVAAVPGCLVEIGTGVGVTMRRLAEIAPDRAIVTIDPLAGFGDRSAAEQKQAVLGRLSGLANVRLIEAKSVEAPFDEAIAGLIIDGDHSYEACKADYEKYAPMVAPGGFVAFHDFCYSPRYVGVVRAAQETGLPLQRVGKLAWAWPQGEAMPKVLVQWPITAICINLDRRTDRWEAIQANVHEVLGGLVRLERFSAVEPDEAQVPNDFQPLEKLRRTAGWGCVSSHIAVLKQAKRQKLPCVLVLEDDARFAVAAKKGLPGALAQLPHDADILYVGGVARGSAVGQVSTELLTADAFSCSHAYIVFQPGYGKILRQLRKGKPEPYDWMMTKVKAAKYGTVRALAGQGGGPSDLIGHTSARMLTEDDAEARPFVHVLGLPDAPLDVRVEPSDAFLWNAERFCRMLAQAGIRFAYYGPPGSQLPEGGQLVSTGHPTATWVYGKRWHKEYTARLRAALDETIPDAQSYKQVVCSLYGYAHADAVHYSYPPFIEAMVGYRDCWSNYKVFPSYAHQTFTYATKAHFGKFKWFDTVIPHFVDAGRYVPREDRGDYALFIGRASADKGLALAKQACEASGITLQAFHKGLFGERKQEVIARARVLFCPTLYDEPGGLVAIEAQMCGVPVICTDWGCFTETVEHGKTGFRCRTMAEFKQALVAALELDPAQIRAWAKERFSFEAVAPQYARYFDVVRSVVAGDYYAPRAVRWAAPQAQGCEAEAGMALVGS